MRDWIWPATAFLFLGLLGGFVAGLEYAQSRAAPQLSPKDIAGRLVGATIDTIGERISSAVDAREDAYVMAMKSDLRNLSVLQEVHFVDHSRYTSNLASLQLFTTPGVSIQIDTADATGYRLSATHAGSDMICRIDAREEGEFGPWCHRR